MHPAARGLKTVKFAHHPSMQPFLFPYNLLETVRQSMKTSPLGPYPHCAHNTGGFHPDSWITWLLTPSSIPLFSFPPGHFKVNMNRSSIVLGVLFALALVATPSSVRHLKPRGIHRLNGKRGHSRRIFIYSFIDIQCLLLICAVPGPLSIPSVGTQDAGLCHWRRHLLLCPKGRDWDVCRRLGGLHLLLRVRQCHPKLLSPLRLRPCL